MAEGTSILQIVGTAITSVAASVGTAIASFKKRLDKMETRTKALRDRLIALETAKLTDRVVDLEKLFPNVVKETGALFDEQHEKLDHNAREAVARAVARATSSDLGAAKEAARQEAQAVVRLSLSQEVGREVAHHLALKTEPIQRELAALRRQLDELKGCVSKGEFTEHIANEHDRWGEIQRTLGQIEGMLQANKR